MTFPGLLLDRDGTVCEEVEYLDDPAAFRLLDGAADAIREARRAGFRVVVVTNQSGIARGLFDEARLDAIHRRMIDLFEAEGTGLDAIYHCPHHPEHGENRGERCACRKPKPGMLLRAALDLDLDLKRSYMVGDRAGDIEAGRRAGTRTVLVQTGYGRSHDPSPNGLDTPNHIAADLRAAVTWILGDRTDRRKENACR